MERKGESDGRVVAKFQGVTRHSPDAARPSDDASSLEKEVDKRDSCASRNDPHAPGATR